MQASPDPSSFPQRSSSYDPGSQSYPEQSHSPRGSTVFVTLHGHFYQPPRENPWLNRIERQPSAAPFHDWNDRILSECYRPNAFARILDDRGQVLQVVNNYEFLSFNIGPTLLSWIEQHDIEVYQRILIADRLSAQRLNGHGNAIAQVYNHIILPLANEQDKRTQIRWGIADFQSRFGRYPEGMWLAETAIDSATVSALVEAQIKFVILGPSQASRCRPLGIHPQGSDTAHSGSEWQDTSHGNIDPRRPYRVFTQDRKGHLDVFFFDGPISRDMGFNDVLSSSHNLSNRLAGAVDRARQDPQLIQCATDGETFGHHKHGVERTLAYAFVNEIPERGWVVTNYAHYLSQHPPSWEVELKPVTAWSCAHGVGRWETDCGCGADRHGQLRWRKPLRQSLNWLRDRLVEVFLQVGLRYFQDPWQARNDYVEVILNPAPETIERFLKTHQVRDLSPHEETIALQLLEMQRFSQLMFTSCGWFFEEISRPEGVQILRYAARAMELAAEISGVNLEAEFVERLAHAPSNVVDFQNGAKVYQDQVVSAQVSPDQIVAHHAMNSLFSSNARQLDLYGYTLEQVDRERRTLGEATLALGRVRLQANITRVVHDLVYAVLHLGGWDFHCGVQPFTGRRHYESIKQQILSTSPHPSRVESLIAIHDLFGRETYTLRHLQSEDRQRIMHRLTQETISQLSQVYRHTYLDNFSVMVAFRSEGLPIPEELKAAAQITLNHRLMKGLWGLEAEDGKQDYGQELRSIYLEAEQLGCLLNLTEAASLMTQILRRTLWQLAHAMDPEMVMDQVLKLEEWLQLSQDIRLPISLDPLQELYLTCLELQVAPRCTLWPQQSCQDLATPVILQLLRLSRLLQVNPGSWLMQSPAQGI